MSAVPLFFDQFPMRRVTAAELDAALAEADAPPLTILFLWGRDCPNCDIAKQAMLSAPQRFTWPEVRWLQDNVYDDLDMAHRFALHGIPVFFVFRGSRLMGRITSWPGLGEFTQAIGRQIAALGAHPPASHDGHRPHLTLVKG
ncbi:thioredoxin [Niveispirillum sp. BGYR6]|uniref:thioredoxin n=1 Tax=Niveispirillum sp. BGYR6 TaxID=2971249 RepID=UPI0022B94EF2|nr:thioredoxin [Niveispirillum sp. BGYR6]MDG5497762.1 thioredoxin [Niveispirillum sp. BGYR6]